MSIEDYRFSDSNVVASCSIIEYDEGLPIVIAVKREPFDYDSEILLEVNKQDSLAIAKHFNQDRESLVSSIKELIENKSVEIAKSEALFERFGYTESCVQIKDLQKPIEGE